MTENVIVKQLPGMAAKLTTPGSNGTSPGAGIPTFSSLVGQIQIQGQLITSDVANLILPLLSQMQQQVLSLLMKGYGIRQAARELGVTHPAVIKHRNKIARIASELLPESEGMGVMVAVRNGGNESGSSNNNPEMCGG